MDGFNATIFAYGQSGSGKTFSMLGPEEVTEILVNQSTELTPEIELLFGIVPRATFHIFDIINEGKQKGTKYTIKVSYIEIYNESINDILSVPPAQNLKLREFPNQGMCVIGMQEIIANTPEAVFEVISAGTANKIVCSTGQNARSSRSHTVFILTCEQILLDGSSKVSKINLVDLAGSEKLSKTGAQGQALKEAQKINLSLTTLGRCIKALTGKGGEHIPFRESKLTLILKESLGGNSKTTLIVTGSMRKVHQEETISTMQFAERAKLVKTAAKSNIKRSVEELEMLVEQMKTEISTLQKKLSEGGSTNYTQDTSELQELKVKYINFQNISEKQIEELTDALTRAKNFENNTEFLEERKNLLQKIEESNHMIERIRYEKETEKKVYEEFITEISDKSSEMNNKILEYQQELNLSNKQNNSLRIEISVRDEMMIQISQEKQDLLLEKNEYLEMLTEMKEAAMAKENQKLELEKEKKEFLAKIEELVNSKKKDEIVIDKLEYYSQSLLEKNEAYEQTVAQQLREIEEYKLLIESLQSDNYFKANQQQKPELLQNLNEAENSKLKNDLKRAHEELEVIKSSLNDSSGSSYQKLSKMKNELDQALDDKAGILKALSEFKTQLEAYETKHKKMSSEYEQQKLTLSVLMQENSKLKKEILDEQQQKTRISKSLKIQEENQKKLLQDAENKIKQKLQETINTLTRDNTDLLQKLGSKEKELKELKGVNKDDYLSLKNELASTQNMNLQLNNQIKILMQEYEQKIDRLFHEKENYKNIVSDKASENMRLKMEISDKDSIIYLLTTKNESLESKVNLLNTDFKENRDAGNKKYPSHKIGLFSVKKVIEKIPQNMIKNLYSNIDTTPEFITEDEEKLENELE